MRDDPTRRKGVREGGMPCGPVNLLQANRPWGKRLFAKNEVHAHAANFDEVAIVEADRPGNGSAIYGGNLMSGSQIVAIVALIDLCSHFRLEPATQPHSSHGRLADDG